MGAACFALNALRTHFPPMNASETPDPAASNADRERRGLWLGLVGVAVFAATLPMTRLAVGDASAPALSPIFVTAGRAAFAAVLSAIYLAAVGARWPNARQRRLLFVSACGTVIGFPLFLALALRSVDAMHAAVVTGLLPLATAVAAAVRFRQRPSTGFWIAAVAGAALVVAFAAWKGAGTLTAADGWLFASMSSAAIGYVAGAELAAEMPGERVVSWVLVLSAPLTVPLAWTFWPAAAVPPSAWAGFAYVTVFSMWLGFFAWYRALAEGGAVRVSQIQLVQPFLAMVFAVPLLGERLDPAAIAFAAAVVATVFIGRSMPAGRPAAIIAAPEASRATPR